MCLIGKRFGRLTVISYAGKRGNHIMVKCKCDCGNVIITRASRINSGNAKSCGCYRRDKNTKHGKRHTKLYNRWCNMRRRCNDSKNRYYKDYGGRGICVCPEWNNSFESFYQWAQTSGYNDSLTLDRIDNNGNYEPNNCRWVTVKEQANNRRSSKYIQYNNKMMTVAQWADLLNIKHATINKRLKMGWPIGEALGFEKHIIQKKHREQ